MAKTNSAERRRFWQELFAKRDALGLSVAQVCQEAGVSQATFYAWRKRLAIVTGTSAAVGSRRGLTKTASPLVPVRIVSDRIDADPYTDDDRRIAGRGARADSTWLRCLHDSGGVASGLCLWSGRTVNVLMSLAAPSVFAYTQPTDMRKSFAGLCGLVEQELKQTVESGHLFLFFNRRRNSVKVLFFIGDGLVIFYRRLERGTFEMPRALHATAGVAGIEMRLSELSLILEGIELSSVRHRRRWRREVASA